MRKESAVDAYVVWALSIALAAIFVVAGVPKLLGIGTVGLQAAAMRGFPGWIRVLAGIVETVCGISLLIPAVATTAAVVLAAAMVPATVTQALSGEGATYVPLLLLALLVFVAWRRNAMTVAERYRGFRSTPHPLLYEGILAGVIGAAIIALWFLVIDSIAGHPLFTPATLGHGLLNALGFGPEDHGMATNVLVYTAFHFAAFMLVGLTASLIVHLARRQPSVVFAFLLLFAVTEVGIYMLVGILDVASPLGQNAWLQIMAGNVIAALAMGVFFWRRHQELGDHFRHSLDWDAAPRPMSQNGAPLGGMSGTLASDSASNPGISH